METKTDYQQQAQDFLTKTRTTFKAEYLDHDLYFPDDREARDIYRVTLKRMGHSYTFRFGQSIAGAGTEPTAYDVLTCLTKFDPGTFEDFCGEFGCDEDSRKALKTYTAVCKEWKGVNRLFGDVLDALQEIA